MQNGKALTNQNISDKIASQKTSLSTDSFKKAMRPQTQRLALEPRIVFDAALPIAIADFIDVHPSFDAPITASEPTLAFDSPFTAPAIETNNTQAERTMVTATDNTVLNEQPFAEATLITGTLAPANLSANEIIFIDAIVADLQAYINDHPQADVVLLDSTKDALDQIAATLAGRTGIESLHILSHGSSGQLEIGNGILNISNLNSGHHAADLAIIKSAMTENGDILIYGCNVAAGEAGKLFINALANYTGADIAASTDTTGAAEAFGGNWTLFFNIQNK